MKFYLALWSSKLLLFVLKVLKRERDDKPGLLVYRICKNFNERVNKPEIVVAVTGTNGKTTVSSLVANMFRSDGKKVGYNDWGANTLAGHARCFIDSVNIFNKPTKDVCVLEVDEMTSYETLRGICPTYILVTNIERDSIRRNDNPDYIFNKLKEGIDSTCYKKIFLNADCPISSFLTDKNAVLYSASKIKDDITCYKAKDFVICPNCYNEIVYSYQQYRSIGKFHCSCCDFKSKDSDYVLSLKDDYCVLKFNNKKEDYSLLSKSIFNLYNEALVLSFFREIGYSYASLKKLISSVSVPKNRIEEKVIGGVKVLKHACKGQNVSASSIVFESLSKSSGNKAIILLLNENYGNINGTETVTWLYETDFEFLNKDNIKKIYVGGPRYLDYKLRFYLAGISDDRVCAIFDEKDIINYLSYDGIDEFDILYEVDNVSLADYFFNYIVNYLEDANEDRDIV